MVCPGKSEAKKQQKSDSGSAPSPSQPHPTLQQSVPTDEVESDEPPLISDSNSFSGSDDEIAESESDNVEIMSDEDICDH